MSDAVKPRRSYHSLVRAQRAQATRRRILDAAARRFLTDGYPATTIDAVAADAAVAAKTIYYLFGDKRGLLKQVMDVTLAGNDEPVPVLDQADPQQVRAESDQGRQIELTARGTAARLERIRPMDDILRSAAAIDRDAAALRQDIQLRQRRAAMRIIAGWIAANGPLRDDMSTEQAGDILWVLTSPDIHRLYRTDCGWTPEQYTTWLTKAAVDALLPSQPATAG
jgi:AcrR family transcriptional regulator